MWDLRRCTSLKDEWCALNGRVKLVSRCTLEVFSKEALAMLIALPEGAVN